MAQVKVTVNGRAVDVWIDEEQTQEVRDFYQAEMKGFRKACKKSTVSSMKMKNVTRATAGPNNSVVFA
jgi:hypothetical protein